MNIREHKFVIISDSKSALEKKKYSANKKVNYILKEILSQINFLHWKQSKIQFAWIRAYCGITQNGEVDYISKSVTRSEREISYLYKCVPEDITVLIKSEMKEK